MDGIVGRGCSMERRVVRKIANTHQSLRQSMELLLLASIQEPLLEQRDHRSRGDAVAAAAANPGEQGAVSLSLLIFFRLCGLSVKGCMGADGVVWGVGMLDRRVRGVGGLRGEGWLVLCAEGIYGIGGQRAHHGGAKRRKSTYGCDTIRYASLSSHICIYIYQRRGHYFEGWSRRSGAWGGEFCLCMCAGYPLVVCYGFEWDFRVLLCVFGCDSKHCLRTWI